MKKQLLITLLLSSLILSACGKPKTQNSSPTPTSKPKAKVNIIDIKDRPYVTLQPLSGRNELEFRIHNLPKEAKSSEVILEYDRNKGVLDAVLKDFSLDKIPYSNTMFMGSKSSGGHITYHDDVIGGTLTMTYSGGKDVYAVEVPWRYDDTQPRYTDLSTTDLKFQLVLDQPFRTPKVIIMKSPGLPAKVDGKVVAGPYLVRGVGPLPDLTGKLTIRLDDALEKVKLLGFNGQKWQEITSHIDGRIVTATVPLVETYVVVE